MTFDFTPNKNAFAPNNSQKGAIGVHAVVRVEKKTTAPRGCGRRVMRVINRVLENRASPRDPALCGYCKCSPIPE
jgi:hypothetical protein